jgi:hypothetical protein
MEILYFNGFPEKCTINWDNFQELSMETVFFELKFIKKVKTLQDIAKWMYILTSRELIILNENLIMEPGFEKYLPRIYFKINEQIYFYEFYHGTKTVKKGSIKNDNDELIFPFEIS